MRIIKMGLMFAASLTLITMIKDDLTPLTWISSMQTAVFNLNFHLRSCQCCCRWGHFKAVDSLCVWNQRIEKDKKLQIFGCQTFQDHIVVKKYSDVIESVSVKNLHPFFRTGIYKTSTLYVMPGSNCDCLPLWTHIHRWESSTWLVKWISWLTKRWHKKKISRPRIELRGTPRIKGHAAKVLNTEDTVVMGYSPWALHNQGNRSWRWPHLCHHYWAARWLSG